MKKDEHTIIHIPLRTIIGSFFTLIWCILTSIDYKNVLSVYNSSNLSYALITVYSLFFAGIIAMTAAVISLPVTNSLFENASDIIDVLLTLSGALAILIMANISAYFTTGPLQTIAIYYQIWSLPALMTSFYHVMPIRKNPKKDFTKSVYGLKNRQNLL